MEIAFHFIITLAALTAEPPPSLVLADGRAIALPSGCRFEFRLVSFSDAKGRRWSIALSKLDLVRTLRPRPTPAPVPAPAVVDRHAIPWDHPQLRDKTSCDRIIVITEEAFRKYRRRRDPMRRQR